MSAEMGVCLGLDTSNYTTSAAALGTDVANNRGRLLDVPQGMRGLRQSEAVFQHVKRLPLLLQRLKEEGALVDVCAVGASTRPRALEDSYMPCFLVGKGQGESIAAALGVPFFACSHQQGHIAAAAWSAGREELLDRPHLAWHLSGGTTELLLVEPEGWNVQAKRVGGSSDLSAGQLVDRTGVLLGLSFPAGKALDELYGEGDIYQEYHVKLNGLTFSLSGMENQMNALLAQGERPANVARFTLDTITDVVRRATQEAQRRWPGLPVLCSGGVASNRRLRDVLMRTCGVLFAAPEFSTDNAMGVAVLTRRGLERGERI